MFVKKYFFFFKNGFVSQQETINEMKEVDNSDDDHPKSLIDAFLLQMKKNINNPANIFTGFS